MVGKAIGKSRWLVSLLIVAAVVAVSVLLIFKFREAPGTLPYQAVSDGSGGVFVAWQDNQGIRLQHTDTSGQPFWTKGGILVDKTATEVNQRAYPGVTLFGLTTDGAGGAILTWQDRLTFPGSPDGPPVKLKSQRISAGGELLWGDGVVTGVVEPISMDTGWIVPDGTGGAVFGWDDYKTYFRAVHDDSLRLQKVSPDGRLLWGPEGVLVTASSPYSGSVGSFTRSWPTYDGKQVVVSDGAGGAIVVWHEEDWPNKQHLVYAERVDADGGIAWPEPILLTTLPNGFTGFSPVSLLPTESDGTACLAVWVDSGLLGERAFTALVRFDMDGKVVSAPRLPDAWFAASDDVGGAIAWQYEDTPSVGPPWERSARLHVQRLDSGGHSLWTHRSVIATQIGEYVDAAVAGDGWGGAVLTWRFGQGDGNAYGKVFALGLDEEGNTVWGGDGEPVFTDSHLSYQGRPIAISSGSSTIVVAAVGRGAMQGDMLYAQKLDDSGRLLWGSGTRIDR